MKKIKPLGSRIVVKRSEAEKTKGGIYLPDSAQEKPKEGTVLAVGPGVPNDEGKLIPLDIKEGDRVLFSSYGGTEVKLEETEYLILKEEEVLGVMQS